LAILYIASDIGGGRMEHELLAQYLEHRVTIHLIATPSGQTGTEEGLLRECSSSGIIMEQDDHVLVYIPMKAVRSVRIHPNPTLWQRLTGTY
jgi:hypothetical protein